MVAEPKDEHDAAVDEDLLPAADIQHLRARRLNFRASTSGNFIDVVIAGYRLPAGFDHDASDLLVRLPANGWPDVKPDMWWFDPWIKIAATGGYPPAADTPEVIEGRRWQRWSRHFSASSWQPGLDGLGTYLAMVDRELVLAVS